MIVEQLVELMSGRGNRSTRRKPAPVPLCPPQIPHNLTRAQTRSAAVGKPATIHLSYGTAYFKLSLLTFYQILAD
jgi:hypothetical protein